MKTLYVTSLVIPSFSLVECKENVDVLIEKFPQHFEPVCRLIRDQLGPRKKKRLCRVRLFDTFDTNRPHLRTTRVETAKCLFCHEMCEKEDINKAKKIILLKLKRIPKI